MTVIRPPFTFETATAKVRTAEDAGNSRDPQRISLNELWEFDDDGLMRRREASINDLPLEESERKFYWQALGPRPVERCRYTFRAMTAIRNPERSVGFFKNAESRRFFPCIKLPATLLSHLQ